MAGTNTEGGAKAPAAADRLGYAAAVLIFYAACLVIVIADIADGKPYHADVDDVLRGLQISHLLAGEAWWFDLSLPFVQMPETYVSPWSRLVDLPYVVFAWMFGLAMPPGAALQLAALVWPPLLLLAFAALAVATARRLAFGITLPRRAEILALVTMAITMVIAVLEFAPGRIDHHNIQIVAMAAVGLGLARWDRAGGTLLGVGSAVSIIVGLECLPFLVVAYAGLATSFVLGVHGARETLAGAAAAMLATTIAGAAAFLGPAAFSTSCDAFSAPSIVLMAGFSAVILGAVVLVDATRSPAFKLAALLVPGAGLLAVVAVTFPSCLDGPYAMIDPVSRDLWLDRLWQEHGPFSFGLRAFHATSPLVASMLVVTLVLLLLAASAMSADWRRLKPGPLILFVLAVVAFVLALLQSRYIRFPVMFAPLFLPAVIAALTGNGMTRQARSLSLTITGIGIAAFAGLSLVKTDYTREADAVDYMAFDECPGGRVSIPAGLSPGRIVAPLGLSMPLLAAMPDGFSVAAIPFHRAAPGMRRMFDAFTTGDPEIRRAALAPFDYVAVCRFPLKPEPGDSPFYAALSAGAEWPGLSRLGDGDDDFQLFRIDHAALR